MPLFVDQLRRTIELGAPAQRIVSLVPSQTELLYDLGLREEVAGITKFCIHPQEWFRSKTRVGGTKAVDIGKVKALQPDLILANKEENVEEQVTALAAHFPVWVSDVNMLEDSLRMIEAIGTMTERADEARALNREISDAFASLLTVKNGARAAYLIWKEPYMTVGGDTFIHDMLTRAGFLNVFAQQSRYPIVTIKDLKIADCDVVLLSSEPYPFRQKHAEELRAVLPATQVLLVDGEMFSWYGSRLRHAPAYFQALQRQVAALL